jgi:hypothetical protein
MYEELDSRLKEIKKGKKNIISRYSKLLDSKKAIDDYYSENDIVADELYERLISLRNKKEWHQTIILSIYITVVFGFFVTVMSEVIDCLKSQRLQFLDNAKEVLDKASLTLTTEEYFQAVEKCNEIMDSTLFMHNVIIVIIIILMIAIALLIIYLLNPLNRLNYLKEDVYKYEIDKINEKLSNIDTKSKE